MITLAHKIEKEKKETIAFPSGKTSSKEMSYALVGETEKAISLKVIEKTISRSGEKSEEISVIWFPKSVIFKSEDEIYISSLSMAVNKGIMFLISKRDEDMKSFKI